MKKRISYESVMRFGSSKDEIETTSGFQYHDDNYLVLGDNLDIMKDLKDSHIGAGVQLVYFDPPYNTGGSERFTYNNRFVNSEWEAMMKIRLEYSRELMREGGFICIAIDHYELFTIGKVADRVFGSENRVGIITVVNNRSGRNQAKFISITNEFMLIYAKDKKKAVFNDVALTDEARDSFDLEDAEGRYRLLPFMRVNIDSLRSKRPSRWYPIYVSDTDEVSLEAKDGWTEVLPIASNGKEMAWKTVADTFRNDYDRGEIVIQRELGVPIIYRKFRECEGVGSIWDDVRYDATSYGTRLLGKLLGRKTVSYPKSLYLMKDILKLMTDEGDVVVDVFAGSGTMGHAVLDLNHDMVKGLDRYYLGRSFILLEILEEHFKVCQERLNKVVNTNGHETFVSMEAKGKLEHDYISPALSDELLANAINRRSAKVE